MFYEDNETGEMFFLAEKNISLKKDYSSSEKFNPDDAANMKYWEKKGYTVVNRFWLIVKACNSPLQAFFMPLPLQNNIFFE